MLSLYASLTRCSKEENKLMKQFKLSASIVYMRLVGVTLKNNFFHCSICSVYALCMCS